jgi:hypothetical protein
LTTRGRGGGGPAGVVPGMVTNAKKTKSPRSGSSPRREAAEIAKPATKPANGELAGPSQPVEAILARAYANPRSRTLAVKAKCYDCEGGDADPNVKMRIGTCGITTCPLWAVRPYQKSAERRPQASTWKEFHGALAGSLRPPSFAVFGVSPRLQGS